MSKRQEHKSCQVHQLVNRNRLNRGSGSTITPKISATVLSMSPGIYGHL